MKTSFETDRLFLREIVPEDDKGFFALDSNPEVHRFLGNNPVKTIEESRDWIDVVRQQYLDNGIGRWAVIEKSTGEFVGWAGLKLERNVNGRERFYDLGYRLRQEFWGKGYATEAARAFLDFGFNELKLEVINAYLMDAHVASRNVLEKIGMRFVEYFEYEGNRERWYEITREEYFNKKAGD